MATILNTKPVTILEKKIYNSCVLGFNRNENWIRKFFKTANVIDYSPLSLSQKFEYLNSLISLLNIFKEKYEEDFDFTIIKGHSINTFDWVFTVRYKDITITNTPGNSHRILDLFVVHSFTFDSNQNKLTPNRIEGLRTTLSSYELHSKYRHSHLGTRESYYFLNKSYGKVESHPFCIGTDSETSKMEAELQFEMDYGRYELYLYLIDSYVRWESLEGTPYISMTKIVKSDAPRFGNISSKDFVNDFILHKDVLDLDFYLVNKSIKIKNNSKTNETLKELILKYCTEKDKEEIFCQYEINSGTYLKYDSKVVSFQKATNLPEPILFRGEKIYNKLINLTGKSFVPKIEDYIVHPNIIKNVIRKLEKTIEHKANLFGSTRYTNSFKNK